MDRHLILRQPVFGKAFLGILGALGAGLAIAGGVSTALDGTATPVFILEMIGLLLGSMALALHFSTTEVHATANRIWLQRYGFTWWSIAMGDAGTTEGTGAHWRFMFVFNLTTGRKVGKFNWFMFDGRDTAEFATFVDEAREALGVGFPPMSEPADQGA